MTTNTRQIVVIAHDIRSAHNVGSLLRTAEGLGVQTVYLTGYTPHPAYADDDRLPHLARRQEALVNKTALGAEHSQHWVYQRDVQAVMQELKSDGYRIVGLEQAPSAIELPQYDPPTKVALFLGREVEGIEPSLLELCGEVVVIPMFGSKESFNVVQAAAMTLYHFRFAA